MSLLPMKGVIGKDEFKQSIASSMFYIHLPSQVWTFQKGCHCKVIFISLSQMKKLSPRAVSDLSKDLGTELKSRASE